MAEIKQPTEENLRELRKFLRLGGLVAVPTETVYGLAGNALRRETCLEIFRVKGRPANDPLICHVADLEAARRIAWVNPTAADLAEAFWPGPLTLVLPKRPIVPDEVTSGLDSVAIRSPDHPVFRKLVTGLDFPLAAPSANPFAYISPTRAEHVQASLGERIRYILDGGPCRHGVESSILDLREEGSPRLLRHGAIPQEELETKMGRQLPGPSVSDGEDANQPALAPGGMPKHYSPKTPLEIRPGGSVALEGLGRDTAAILLREPCPSSTLGPNIHWLSKDGRLEEIAANLYAKLQELDAAGYRCLVVEQPPQNGLGRALNDRLRRAASR